VGIRVDNKSEKCLTGENKNTFQNLIKKVMMTIINRTTLKEFLQKHGVKKAGDYTQIKYSGGRDSAGYKFVGWIPFNFSNRKISTIVLPYLRDDSKEEVKPEYESELETLFREVEQEVGFKFNGQDAFKICNFTPSGDEHQQIFYGTEIPLDFIPDMKQFPFKNWHDSEKGKPIFEEFLEIIWYLPTAHLNATVILMKKITGDYFEELLENKHDELDKQYINYAYQVIEAIDMENERREEAKKKRSK